MRGRFQQCMRGRGVPCAVAFGVGLALSSFCPVGLILFIVAVLLVCLGVSLIRH
ncbi:MULTISPECIES: hypothetical protein [Caproicibacterium]|uniref:Uncharacterized protein n=1 Tax=Caproicibacterium argilliputei TaxID=3030016 RepID=A0AA97H026_9FIRM|nr:hypothetical protein [Caproicibacterium argilliputei]WOC31033.1 hypothetical protein PXC00_07250 [Caproicibacterium argilliputei]